MESPTNKILNKGKTRIQFLLTKLLAKNEYKYGVYKVNVFVRLL